MTEWKPERGWIKRLESHIPKTPDGDPAFLSLPAIREVFNDEMLVYIVNKYLYAQLYNREYHQNRAREERAVLKPIKAKVHELFHVSYLNATTEQIQAAITAVRKDLAKRLER